MRRYNPSEIEPKWQQLWADDARYHGQDFDDKPKYYVTGMFPYPSGAGMHTGHFFEHSIVDAVARFRRALGHNVVYPMGWDSFGLPAENYAIKTGTAPAVVTKQNIANFKNQLTRVGASIDWSREINTTDPEYYKWTQWVFTQMYERDLAYQKESLQWWCPVDKTVLANEQVEGGKCWRCGSEVEKKSMKQWFFKITDYADELLEDIPDLNWPEKIKTAQTNWIGRSVGAEIDFQIKAEKPLHYVILHGYTGSPDANFIPWVKSQLERAGHTVETPALPDTKSPNVEQQAQYVLETCTLNENTVVVGHSLGVPVALEVLERLDAPVRRFISIAGFAQPGFMDRKRPFEEDTNWNFDFEKIKKNAGQVTILRAANDTAVPAERADFLKSKVGGSLVDFKAEQDHVCGTQEPVVLDQLLEKMTVFSTRPDTLFGATFLVLAPEHPLARALATDEMRESVENYIDAAVKKSEIERQSEGKEKTGVWTGSYAINPANGEQLPIWIADYVLGGYGTGAVMAVPAHDERDYAFAEKFSLPIVDVIEKPAEFDERIYHGEGTLINSGEFDGRQTSEAREEIVAWLGQQGLGRSKVTYKMRDWLISRQRYWGAPIPIIHCDEHGAVPVPVDQLPVVLPEVEDYTPKGDGKSVLARETDWVNTTCPTCGKPAKRETDTMDGYACSSWYLLRYTDPHNAEQAWDPAKASYWSPVDMYVGGDHAVAHLLYVRFWNHVFYDMGLVPEREPVKQLVYHGLIQAEDGRKMSKSLGNVVDPLEVIDAGYGADALRTFELFLGPINENSNWSSKGIAGVYRFLNRVWTLVQEYDAACHSGLDPESSRQDSAKKLETLTHATTKKVTSDIHRLSFNTAISALMEYVNELYKLKTAGYTADWQQPLEMLVQLVQPFAPHMAAELWQQLGHDSQLDFVAWPQWDESKITSDTMMIIVQVNGKLRAKLELATDTPEEDIKAAALGDEHVQSFLGDKKPTKVIYVPCRLVSIVA